MALISDLPSGQTIYTPWVQLLSSASVINWDLSAGQIVYHIATQNTTLQNPTNMKAGWIGKFYFKQHASAPKTMAFGSVFQRADQLPIMSTALNAVCIMDLFCDGTYMIIENYQQNLVV